jgi:fructuronate reductase
MAAYIDGVLAADPSWGIVGASLKRPDTRNALVEQDFLYTLAIKDGSGTRIHVIGSLLEVLDGAAHRDRLLAAMIDPRIRIVSLTVTEKGYCHNATTGELDPRHPDIVHDLAHPDAPVSAPGFLVRAMELRREAGIPSFTVLSCDNLPANGEITARVVVGMARRRDEALARYIADEVAFPCTMVDRIVPATTEDDRRLVLEITGLEDSWPVVTEPFSQWVIEDRFPSGRPPFEIAEAQLVSDVRPYELTKLRMLNGSHSMLAYLGYLAGYKLVNEAIADASLQALVVEFMTEEVMSTLPVGVMDLTLYRDALLERLRNPALRHQTWQIAMDGSQKLPQRLLGTVRDRLAQNASVARATLGVAAWMRYATGLDEQGHTIDLRDPLAARLRTIANSAEGSPARLVDGFLAIQEVFGDDLPRNETFRQTLTRQVDSLLRLGAIRTVRQIPRS